VIVAEPAVEIVPAVAKKLALVDPAVTVTDAGTVSSEVLLNNVTTAPPLGAAAESETLQEVDWPELKLAMLHATPVNVGSAGAETTNVADIVVVATTGPFIPPVRPLT
jgi:hypothetical protein